MRTGLAIYGGTFDPIHRGHLASAAAALEQLPVDSVHFLVAGTPPHKNPSVQPLGTPPSPADHRVAMVRAAVDPRPGMEVDDREVHREGPSFTVLTLRELRQENPNRDLYFMIGSDNWAGIGDWYEADEIFELSRIVIMPRPGFAVGPSADRSTPIVLTGTQHDVSSREVRARIANRESIEGWVPPEVAEYVELHGLYSNDTLAQD